MERILIGTDYAKEKSYQEIYPYLTGSGAEKVYSTSLADLVEQYAETMEDGWHVVLIKCDGPCAVLELVQGIRKIAPEQSIVVETNVPDKMCESVRGDENVICAPHSGVAMAFILSRMGYT